MNVDQAGLEQRFLLLDDGELLRRYRSGDLTDAAAAVATRVLALRGIPVDGSSLDHLPDSGRGGAAAAGADDARGSVVCLARFYGWMDAQVLCARLEAEGIAALAGDAELVRANAFLTQAVGGIRVLVYESDLARAREVWSALKRGDYALDDDHAL